MVCLAVIGLSVPGFLDFRQFCLFKGYHVYSMSGIYVLGLGFFAYFVLRWLYRQSNTATTTW